MFRNLIDIERFLILIGQFSLSTVSLFFKYSSKPQHYCHSCQVIEINGPDRSSVYYIRVIFCSIICLSAEKVISRKCDEASSLQLQADKGIGLAAQ